MIAEASDVECRSQQQHGAPLTQASQTLVTPASLFVSNAGVAS